MKKNKAKLLLLLCLCAVVVFCIFAFTACGNDKKVPPTDDENKNEQDGNDDNDDNDTHTTHAYGEWEITVQPTCTVAGKKERSCSCGDKQTEIIPASHTLAEHDGQEATCEHIGWEAYQTCSKCDYTTYEEIPVRTEHNYSDGVCVWCGEYEITLDVLNFTLKEDNTYEVVCTDRKNVTYVGIPSEYKGLPVTSIGRMGFYYCQSLENIVIPDSITVIGYGGLYYCSALKSVKIPDSVTEIDYGGFGDCRALESIVIPSGVVSIGGSAFQNCTSLQSVVIQDGVTSIGGSAFKNCSSLESIIIPESVTSIGSGAFWSCTALENISVPESIETIGHSIFEDAENIKYNEYDNGLYVGNETNKYTVFVKAKNSDISSCVVNGSTKMILDNAFIGCDLLKTLKITEGVRYIGGGAILSLPSLEDLYIPDSIDFIGEDNFEGCDNLKYNEYDNAVYLGNETNKYLVLVKAKDYFINSCVINSSTKIMYNNAFNECEGLTEITIPESVTYIGDWAFNDNNALTIYCEAEENIYGSLWNANECPVVWNCKNNDVADDGYIYIMYNNIRYALKDGEAAVAGQSAFISGKITIETEIIYNGIAYKVTAIREYAFKYALYAYEVMIPESIKTVEERAFWYCDSVMIYCEAKEQPEGWHSNWNQAKCPVVWDCKNNDVAEDGNIYIFKNEVRYTLKDGVVTINEQPTNLLGNIVIENSIVYNGISYSVTAIESYAFYRCADIESIEISDSVTTIGEYAFAGCSLLTSVKTGNGVTTIGRSAFMDCLSLITVEIGNSVTEIGAQTFQNCRSLESVVIPVNVTTIREYAFSGCSLITIYCEAESKPDGWIEHYWNNYDYPVVWGYKG